ncbi:dihydrofolate reductase family protein [Rhodococcus sp. BP22]|uniref:dihydrofolate reductase family protein n=1 Tax=Rhodococcus sp. BP22 TaxID=2758566 RepID=UPI0016482AAF|nr:dihydrofolate reductase family protein [Rhodococcus sp. BP22]
MTRTTAHVSISLDGFVAGPDQDKDNPLGVGGLQLHTWHIGEATNEADAAITAELLRPRGAFIMGRNMFGPVRGEWDEDWSGWWGDNPPYHAPVFVLTHYQHEPIEMAGGTTFRFVTDGFGSAYAQAQAVAGENDISIAGGASTVRQALAAGVIDELVLDITPVLLGSGESPFEGLRSLSLEPLEAIHSPFTTHVRYRVKH